MKLTQTSDYVRVAVIAIGSLAGQVFLVAFAQHPAIAEIRRAVYELLVLYPKTLLRELGHDVASSARKDFAGAKDLPSQVKDFSQDALNDLSNLALPESLRATHYIVIQLVLLVLLTFVAGVATGNYSQVDKIWSMTPAMFAWTYALADPKNVRLSVIAVVLSVWAIRLTLNFNRRGGYTWPPWLGEEDYRWKHVMAFLDAKRNRLLWQMFHFGFICLTQNVLLFLIVLPVHFAWYDGLTRTPGPLGEWDLIASGLVLLLVMGEALTDDAQFVFQETKYAYLAKNKPLPSPYSQGFLSTGAFAMSRHFNYFCEQSIWLVLNLYLYPATGGRELVTSASLGFVLLALLFQGSIWLQEQTTAAKWPLYAEYIEQVPQLLPLGYGFKPKVKTN